MANLVFGIKGEKDVIGLFTREFGELVQQKGGTVRAVSEAGLLSELANKLGCSFEAVSRALGKERIKLLLDHELRNSAVDVTIFPEANGDATERLLRDASISGEGIVVDIKTGDRRLSGVERGVFTYHRTVMFDGSEEDARRQAECLIGEIVLPKIPHMRSQEVRL